MLLPWSGCCIYENVTKIIKATVFQCSIIPSEICKIFVNLGIFSVLISTFPTAFSAYGIKGMRDRTSFSL
jgi:hypothetical protein